MKAELLVSHERQHLAGLPDQCAGEQALAHAGRFRPGFVLSTHALCELSSPLEIGVYILRSPQVVGNHGIDIGERQRWVLLGDLLGGRATMERRDDRVQGDAASPHSDGVIAVSL